MEIGIEEEKILDVATARARFELAINQQAEFLRTYRTMTDIHAYPHSSHVGLISAKAKRLELAVKSAKRALESAIAAQDG